MTKKNLNKILNIILFIAILSSFGYKMVLSDSVSTAGSNLVNYEEQIDKTQKEIEILQKEYLAITSLSKLSQSALENGYVNAQYEYYSSPELAVASN
jgi:hypothetical protein